MLKCIRLDKMGKLAGMIVFTFLILMPQAAWSITTPGLMYSVEFRPEMITFPERFKESNKAIYQSARKLLKFPEQQKVLEEEHRARILKIRTSELDALTAKEQIGAANIELKEKTDALNAEWNEFRGAFLFLAGESLSKNADPYILLFMAQQLHKDRGQPPAVMQKEMVDSSKKDQPEAKEADQPAAEQPAEEKEDATAKISANQPATGQPSILAGRNFKSNYERIIAACEEIQERFPNFEYMDRVIRLLADVKMELGMKEDAIYLWKTYLKYYKEADKAGYVLFGLGEYEFATPTSFDHFTTAAEYYEKALKHFGSGRMHFLCFYKLGWSQYLSPDLSEDALGAFVKLYREIKKSPEKTEEIMQIRSEIIEVIKQIKSQENRMKGRQFSR